MRQKAKMGHLFRIARVAISFFPAGTSPNVGRFRLGPVDCISASASLTLDRSNRRSISLGSIIFGFFVAFFLWLGGSDSGLYRPVRQASPLSALGYNLRLAVQEPPLGGREGRAAT